MTKHYPPFRDQALQELASDGKYHWPGEDFENIVWVEPPSTIPTEQQLIDKIKELEDADKLLQYKRDRREKEPKYLPIEDQLDLHYWDLKNGTTNWVDHIDAVKAAHPKPPDP